MKRTRTESRCLYEMPATLQGSPCPEDCRRLPVSHYLSAA
jgi:hypothetical protein